MVQTVSWLLVGEREQMGVHESACCSRHVLARSLLGRSSGMPCSVCKAAYTRVSVPDLFLHQHWCPLPCHLVSTYSLNTEDRQGPCTVLAPKEHLCSLQEQVSAFEWLAQEGGLHRAYLILAPSSLHRVHCGARAVASRGRPLGDSQ